MLARNLILAAAAVGGVLLIPQTAGAVTFKVTSVQHSSSSAKTDLPYYQGSSSARWSLAKRTRKANNRFTVAKAGKLVYGSGMVNVRGVFHAQASSETDSCGLTAPTGSEEYAAVAPQRVILALSADPKGRLAFAFTGVRATLGNPYFGSGCSTTLTGEPSADDTNLKHVKASLFRKKRFTIHLAGTSFEDGIAYKHSTVFKFARAR